jgi:2-polyprenyl-6-methoxyphenol hydroxylase-like FAD-dependent oxidoreductase
VTHADVAIVGAGPVGLTLANILGLHGITTLIIEQRDTLIDYPPRRRHRRRVTAGISGDRADQPDPAAH